MEYVNLNANWLEQQIRETRREVDQWPDWFKEQQSVMATENATSSTPRAQPTARSVDDQQKSK
ncbi:MAG: hypothetical protein JNL96_25595 [Planctomycetaceae bacterium]|nr:hypothetical protein [Planctomycetaceae bacterium]